MTDLPLASLFPPATEERWRALVDGVLKDADFDRKLVSRTYDGLRVEPLYPKADGAVSVGRATHGPWRIAQRVDHPHPAEANALALADLEGGADALVLVAAGTPTARGFGIASADVDALDEMLSGCMLDLVSIRLDGGLDGIGAASAFIELARRRGQALAELDLDLALDPIGAAARSGRSPANATGELAATLAAFQRDGFRGRVALADGRPYHEAGAGEAQELACVLATATAYLRALEAGGHSVAAARDSLAFLLVADADQFLTIAKLRALRRLWHRVEEACGIAPAPIRLHAETAWRMTTRRDPWVNILRGTLATFSAGLGGADIVTGLPFTSALGLPDAFARRIARNTQLILLEEANLWRVHDPVAGAGGFEALTDGLAEAAWAQFQEIEREGGMAASLLSGAIQRRIAKVRATRERAVATRRDPITGTSEFPDLREAPVSVLMSSPLAQVPHAEVPGTAGPRSTRDGAPRSPPSKPPSAASQDEAENVEPLPSSRGAEPFERLRDMSDEALARTGLRPGVFLATLGPLAAFSVRATYAKNAFEAGGIEAPGSVEFPSSDAMVNAFTTSGAHLACLCSTDDIYAAEAALAASELKRAGASAVYLAGRPGNLEERLRQAGVDGFLFVGSDILALLTDAAGREKTLP